MNSHDPILVSLREGTGWKDGSWEIDFATWLLVQVTSRWRFWASHPLSKACLQHYQTVIQSCMWFMEEPSQFSVGQTAQTLSSSIMEKPHTGLDDSLWMLHACFRKRMSVLSLVTKSIFSQSENWCRCVTCYTTILNAISSTYTSFY